MSSDNCLLILLLLVTHAHNEETQCREEVVSARRAATLSHFWFSRPSQSGCPILARLSRGWVRKNVFVIFLASTPWPRDHGQVKSGVTDGVLSHPRETRARMGHPQINSPLKGKG